MKTLIIVDVQNDFCSGGALPVPDGQQVVPVINRIMARFDLVVATQDWHPADHGSFAVNHPGRRPGEQIELDGLPQVLWPAHCVQGTPGAELHPGLDRSRIARVFRKGTNARIDSYSGFFDNGRRSSTGLGEYLKAQGAGEVYVAGLATDYCVKATAIDAVGLGLPTRLIEDACRGIELRPGDVRQAIAQMRQQGIVVVQSGDLGAVD
jgi:nicotinamidase/pyrazinamidase